MKKRGSSQVDWAISLGIFLLYLAWFFILARPQLSLETDISTLAEFMLDEIEENASWTVTKTPIFIDTDHSGALEPLILDFPYSWEDGSYAFLPERYFMRDGQELYAVHTVTGEPFTAWILHSDHNYTMPGFSKDLEATADYARISQHDFELSVENSTVGSVKYQGEIKVSSYELYINGVPLNLSNASFTGSAVIAKYSITTDLLNQSLLVFPEHPRIFFDFGILSSFEHTVTLAMVMDNYNSYYLDAGELGDFNYSVETCISGSSAFLDLHNSLQGVALISDNVMSLRMCTDNSSLIVNASVLTSDDFEIAMVFHPGDYSSADGYSRPKQTGSGVAFRLTGLNLDSLESLSGYDELKTDWDFPENTDYSITLRNRSEVIFSFRDPVPLVTDTVIVRERNVFVLDEQGTLTPYKLAVRVW